MAEVIETSNPTGLPAGTLDENLSVICAEDALKIIKIKPADRSLMNFTAFVNGWQTRPGDLFMKIDN
jgi:methionyl-tRNA formyltransferase